MNVFGGLREDGYVLINSSRSPHELGIDEWFTGRGSAHVQSVAATGIAREHTRANAALLGGLAALTGVVSLRAVEAAIGQRLPATVAAGDAQAAMACHDEVLAQLQAVTPA